MTLRIENLALDWGDFRLAGDLTLPAASHIAVIGPSGAGKSTLLSVLAGFAPKAAGRITWDGRDITTKAPWERPVATLFQDANLFPHLDIMANVALALDPKGRITPQTRARVEDMLAAVGLEGLSARKPGALSGGQQSRAALARVLLQDRPLVLLDEPFAALGPGLKDEMLHLAARLLRDAGRAMLLVTHDPAEARAVAEGIVLVAEGKIDGPHPVAILDNPPPALAAYLGQAR